jgi:formate hydrogenlyase subunit 3/multisubunit Na+/H+ antiporter MnhD subunit
LTLAGNLLLVVSEDIASFYLGFSLMTFAAYGLVVNADTRDARTGGLVYLIMGVLGEGLILAGLLWAAGSIGTTTLGGLREGLIEMENGVWMGVLLWLGFGIKTGVIGLHFWLPLAHGVAPTPASAVLSGVMIKAGLLGWLLTLPLGEPGAGEGFRLLGQVMVIAGMLGALGAAIYGAAQRYPKAVLAYSSISQMGMLTALVAMGLVAPEAWPALSSAVLLFAAHHGLTKGALFLGVGIAEHPPRLPTWLLAALLTLPALSLTGLLLSGLATKWAFKSALYGAGREGLVFWLSLAAVGTTLLMARVLWLQWAGHRQSRCAGRMPLVGPMPLAWLATLMAAVTLPWWLPVRPPEWPSPSQWLDFWWPVALGLGLCLSAWAISRHRTLHLVAGWHAGDLWWPLAVCWKSLAVKVRPWILHLAEVKTLAGESLNNVEAWLVDRAERMLRGETLLRRHLMVLMTTIAVLVAILLMAGDG